MTSKQRKLKYIREKNDLRNGKASFIGYVKVSRVAIYDGVLISDLIADVFRDCLRKYKLVAKKYDVLQGEEGDDFIRGLLTLKVTLTL